MASDPVSGPMVQMARKSEPFSVPIVFFKKILLVFLSSIVYNAIALRH
jgi:hypothetical protein